MSSAKPNSIPSPESVHDVWLRQRTELEHDLFEGWKPITCSNVEPVSHATLLTETLSTPVPSVPLPKEKAIVPKRLDQSIVKPQDLTFESDKTERSERLKLEDDAALKQRIEYQRYVDDGLHQQREAFFQDLARLRAAFEQDLSMRESAWSERRDQEWAALQNAKEVHEATQQRLNDELTAKRIYEREELTQWRQQAEAELAEARRLFEQERLQQQQEFAQQRQTEMLQLRREREEFDVRVRQVQAELAAARQQQEDELRRAQETQAAQVRAERAELDKLRNSWLEKFRREQVVLENGLQFFGQHLSRVSEELRVAHRGLQAVSESATEASPGLPIVTSAVPVQQRFEPPVLNLQEFQERLNLLRQTQQEAA